MITIRIGAALALGLLAASGAAAEPVKSLCQVELKEAPEAPARRAETVAFMKRVEGQVRVLRPKASGGFDEMKAEIGMELRASDAVATGGNGAFDAIFTDNSTLTGVADTCVEISTYLYDAAAKTGEFRMRLGRGVVSVAAGEVAKSAPGRMSVMIRDDANLAVTGTRIVIRAN